MLSRVRKLAVAVVGFGVAGLVAPEPAHAMMSCSGGFGMCNYDDIADAAYCASVCPGFTGFQCMEWPPVNGPTVLVCWKDPI